VPVRLAALALLLALQATPARAARPPHAPYMLLRDTDTGEVLYEHGSDQIRPIASITKLMTAMVALDEEFDLDRVVRLQPIHMLTPMGWRSPWTVGRAVTLGELFDFALTASDNIAATTIAEESGLPLDVFLRRMNDKAHELGMLDTHFGNVTGIADRNDSTAQDVARMVEAAARYPRIRQACALQQAAAAPVDDGDEEITGGATDRLLWDPFWSIRAAKTGYTRLSGYCFTATADAATGQRVTLVFLGLDRSKKRFRQADRIRDALLEQAAGGAP
jgi:serine-type D-Ala-D-Ala endopeptidase (penicillin-binding protein 7)